MTVRAWLSRVRAALPFPFRVYAVWTGCYSDAEVRSVFAFRRSAERYAAELRDGVGEWGREDVRIMVYPLNVPRARLAGAWAVTVAARGQVSDEPSFSLYASPGDAPIRYRDGAWLGYGRTPAHARRSAEEARRAHMVQTDALRGPERSPQGAAKP